MPHLLLLLHQQLQHQPLFHHLPHTTTTTTTRSSCLLVVNPRTSSTAMMPIIKTHNFFQQKTLTPRTVKCMANPRRVKMVAKQIQREISTMLITDKVLKYAILPEAALGADRYLSSLTTVSDVEISPDLQIVKVYVSFFGDERGKEVALAGLKSKAKYVRAQLGKRMRLRLTPEVRFIEDDSLERGSEVIAILDRLKEERENAKKTEEDDEDEEQSEDEDEEQSEDEDEDEDEEQSEDDMDNEEEEEDDTAGGIIYVK